MRAGLAIAVAGLAFAAVAVAASPPALTGRYSVKLTMLQPPSLDGTWALRFAAGSAYSLTTNGAVVESGVYTLHASTLILHDTSGPLHCAPSLSGSYRSIRTGAKLRLVLIADRCTTRSAILAHTFAKAT